MMSQPGGVPSMIATAPFGFRYQYLAGGVLTSDNWSTWNPNGQFATYYIADSIAAGIIPTFTFYMLCQSSPALGCGRGGSLNESDSNYNNLNSTATMTAYYNNLKLFFQRAAAFPSETVVLHVEPDLWAYLQRRASGDNATTVSAKVAATGLADLAGLPDNARGFAQAIVRLRDTYAPNVRLGYHMSTWGTGEDPVYSNPSLTHIDALAARSAGFYSSLQAAFDVVFAEFSDRDAAFKQYQYGDAAAWWDTNDYARSVRYLTTFVGLVQKRVVMWQIPYGNTKMRAMNNVWGHYQDNRVEWLLDEPGRVHLAEYREAGVIAFLFGQGAGGTTCPCDAMNDGVTNPAPISSNTLMSLSADDDGGFFRQKAAAYYTAGAMPLTSVVKGDANGDGLVTITDALAAAQCALAIVSCSTIDTAAADVNCNGSVQITDAQLIAQKALDIIAAFPC